MLFSFLHYECFCKKALWRFHHQVITYIIRLSIHEICKLHFQLLKVRYIFALSACDIQPLFWKEQKFSNELELDALTQLIINVSGYDIVFLWESQATFPIELISYYDIPWEQRLKMHYIKGRYIINNVRKPQNLKIQVLKIDKLAIFIGRVSTE